MGSPISSTETTFWKGVSALCITLTFVVLIINCVFVAKQDATFRICNECKNGSSVFGYGLYNLDADTDNIAFEFQSAVANASGITAILIRGPIVLGSSTGPIAGALCGAPSNLVCSLVPPLKQIAVALYDGINPVSNDLRPLMNRIREQPHLYYIEVLTNAHPTSPGECRTAMNGACGFA